MKANGHDHDGMNFYKTSKKAAKVVDEEKFPASDKKGLLKAATVMEKLPSGMLKSQKVVWGGQSYPNPYGNWSEHGGFYRETLEVNDKNYLLKIREDSEWTSSSV